MKRKAENYKTNITSTQANTSKRFKINLSLKELILKAIKEDKAIILDKLIVGFPLEILDDLTNEGMHGLHLCSKYDAINCFNYLIVNKNINLLLPSPDGSIALHFAAKWGSNKIFKYILNSGIVINAKNIEGKTALHYATLNGHKKIAVELIRLGIGLNTQDENGLTPLHLSIIKNHNDIAINLIKNKAGLNALDNHGLTALHYALIHSQPQIAEMLIKEGINIHAKDKAGNSALHLAVGYGLKEIVQLLLKKGVNIYDKGSFGNTPSQIASLMGNKEILEMIQSFEVSIAKLNDIDNVLNFNIESTKDELVPQKLNAEVLDLNKKDLKGNNLLHGAIYDGNTELAIKLIKAGININEKNSFGNTPLHLSVMCGNIEVMKCLLNYKANINEKNFSSCTALYLTAMFGHLEMANLLLNHNSDIEVKDNKNKTPLDIAISHNHAGITKAIINHKGISTISAKHNSNKKLVFIDYNTNKDSAESKELKFVPYKVPHNILNINARDKDGYTLLHSATYQGDIEKFKMLINNPNIDINAQTPKGNTALHLAILRGNFKIAEMLIMHNADITLLNKENKSIFDLAVLTGCTKEVIKMLNKYETNQKLNNVAAEENVNYELNGIIDKLLATFNSFPSFENFNQKALPIDQENNDYNNSIEVIGDIFS